MHPFLKAQTADDGGLVLRHKEETNRTSKNFANATTPFCVIDSDAKLNLSGNFLSANNHVSSTDDKHIGRSQKSKSFLL